MEQLTDFIDAETLAKLPPIFQTLKATPLSILREREAKAKKQLIEIDFYQTPAFSPYSHYKPLSKIICLDADE
jgi:hypothetical protein